jgi:hypothetical protein
MEMTLRVAVMEDVAALQQLIPHAARELSKGFYTPQQIESAIQYIFGVDTQLIADRTYYIQWSGKKLRHRDTCRWYDGCPTHPGQGGHHHGIPLA